MSTVQLSDSLCRFAVWLVHSAKVRTIDSTSAPRKWRLRRHVDPMGEISSEELRAAPGSPNDRSGAACCRRISSCCRSTPVIRVRQPDLPAGWCEHHRWQTHENGGNLVYESTVLSGCPRGSLHPGSGEKFRDEMAHGLSTWATARRASTLAIGAQARDHREGGPCDTPQTLEQVAKLYGARGPPSVSRLEHQGSPKGQGHREYPARLNIALVNELAIIFNRIASIPSMVLQQPERNGTFCRSDPA